MSTRRTLTYLRSFVMLLAVGIPASIVADDFKPTYWTLKPKEMEDFPLAKVAMIGGQTFPDANYGVHLQLLDIKVTQPIDVYLVSKSVSKSKKVSKSKNPLDMIVFKSDPSEPLLQVKTDEDGVAKLDFRADGPVYFRITGPEQSEYELIAVVGPEVEPRPKNNMVTWTQFEQKTRGQADPEITTVAADTVETSRPPSESPSDAAASTTNSSNWTAVIVALLALILVALVVLVVILLKRPKAGAAMVAGMIVLFCHHVGEARDERIKKMLTPTYFGGRDEFQKQIAPFLVSRDSLSEPGQSFLGNSQKAWSNVNKALGTGKKMVDLADLLSKYLKAQYGHIDPRAAAVQPNYDPRGKPVLPSSYLQNRKPLPGTNEAKIYGEYLDLSDRIDKAHKHLEGNYTVRKNTEYEVGIIHEMASAATGLSPLAQIAWARAKSNPKEGMNQSAAKFYKLYDDGQQNGLDYLHTALEEMGQFEAKYYGVENWYLKYGLPFYQFMSFRYIRPEP